VTDINDGPSIEGVVDVIRLIRRLFRKRWRIVVLAAVCGAAIGYFLTFAADPAYWAKATLYVAPPISGSATDAVAGDQYAQDRTQLYWQLAKSDELAQRVAKQMQSTESPAVVANRISVSLMHEAPLLTIQATGRSGDAARSLAQAYLDQLPDYARSVEQNSGLREGPVLVTVARPIEVTESTAGVKPRLKVVLSTALFGAAALIYTMLDGRRHPTVRGVDQLRKAVPAPWVVQVDGSPGEMARIQAMLFAGTNSARKVILAGARSEDGLDEMITEFKNALQGPIHLLPRAHLISQPRLHSNDVAVLAAPALLEQHERITALAARSSTGIMISAVSSVIVCLKGQTRLEDVIDLEKLLSLNGIEVKGILVARRSWRKRVKRRVASSPRADNTDRDWARIEVIECGRPSGNGNGTLS
jgi:capsular polysaccharide biosynthesis protein